MDRRPVLTFAIPTWDRADFLNITLKHLTREIDSTGRDVEIFVSDNASSDKTRDVLEEWARKYNFVRFSINKSNEGFDKNLISAIRNSRGIYVWTFSDDDIIADGVLKKVIEYVEKYDPSYIAVQYDEFVTAQGDIDSINILEMKKQDPLTLFNREELTSTFFDIDFSGVIEKEFTRVGFVSMNIFNKELLDLEQIEENLSSMSAFSHILLIAQATFNGNGILLPFVGVHFRKYNVRGSVMVIFDNLPRAFEFVFSLYKVDKSIQNKFFRRFKKIYLPFFSFIGWSLLQKIQIDSISFQNNQRINYEEINKRLINSVTFLYLEFVLPIIPKRFVLFMVKIYWRLICRKSSSRCSTLAQLKI